MRVTLEYYKDVYNGYVGNYSDDDLTQNIKHAEQVIDSLTQYRLVNGQIDFDKLPVYIQDSVKRATCMLAEHYIMNGGYLVVQASNDSTVNSATVGKFSYSNGTGGDGRLSIEDSIPSLILELLASTGLMYNGVMVSGYVY